MRLVNRTLLLPLALMVVFAMTRWPGLMPENFSAAYAIAFCAGVYFGGPMGWLLPLGVLLVTDILINALYYSVAPVHWSMLLNYGAFAAIIWIGRRVSSKASFLKLLCGGLLGAIVFYLVTNTAAWLQLPYPKSLGGWIQAITTGLPPYPPTWTFFRNTLLSGGLFTALFVGSVKLSEAASRSETEEEEEAIPEEPQAQPK